MLSHKTDTDLSKNPSFQSEDLNFQLVLRFGLYGTQALTQKEVADKMGISQSYISRLEKKIIDKLKVEMDKKLTIVAKK